MVIQKTSNGVDASQPNSSSEDSNSSWQFQPPGKLPVSRPLSGQTMQAKLPITRQVAINTLAAMHRRFSLPGAMQPHSRPVAEFRASANKSLDILRQTIQSAVSKEIDEVIKKYLEKFFVPAVRNIRSNLGEESVTEDQIRVVCRAMLDATRSLYTAPPKPSTSAVPDAVDNEGSNDESKLRQIILQSPLQNKRKDLDLEIDSRRKRMKQEDTPDSNSASPLPLSTVKNPDKWNPARITPETLFIMGSHAHKVLGLGNSRGRLYTKHAGLLRYPADSADKEWISSHNLVNAIGGKTYIMVLEDIEELAASDHYKHNALPMLGELTGFKAPPFMLRKIKAFIAKRSLSNPNNPTSPQPSTSSDNKPEKNEEDHRDDLKDNIIKSEYLNFDKVKEETDFDDIKDDGLKVDDIDDIKVESIKVGDIDVNDIKVEDIDVDDIKVEDIDVNDIKVEDIDVSDIKVENVKDEFSVDDNSQLVDGLSEADIEFLSRNLGNIESEADTRKTLEKLTGANPDTLTLVGDEFDFGNELSTSYGETSSSKCITVASTTSGMVHSVPVAHIAQPRLSSTLHYYGTGQSTVHHLPQATVTIHSVPGTSSHVIRGIPINPKTGSFSTVMSQGTANILGIAPRTSSATVLGNTAQFNVSPKSFPTGNILHNAIVSRNIISRSSATSKTYLNTSTSKMNTLSSPTVSATNDFDTMSTTKDMIDNACNSSVMLKKVLTLGSAAVTKSFMMQNTQKVLATGYSNANIVPNVTIVSSANIPTSVSLGNTVTLGPSVNLSTVNIANSNLVSGQLNSSELLTSASLANTISHLINGQNLVNAAKLTSPVSLCNKMNQSASSLNSVTGRNPLSTENSINDGNIGNSSNLVSVNELINSTNLVSGQNLVNISTLTSSSSIVSTANQLITSLVSGPNLIASVDLTDSAGLANTLMGSSGTDEGVPEEMSSSNANSNAVNGPSVSYSTANQETSDSLTSSAVAISQQNVSGGNLASPTASTLSATHATLSALLASSSENNSMSKN